MEVARDADEERRVGPAMPDERGRDREEAGERDEGQLLPGRQRSEAEEPGPDQERREEHRQLFDGSEAHGALYHAIPIIEAVRPALFLALLLPLTAAASPAAPPKEPTGSILVADLNTEIHAVSADFVIRTIEEAGAAGAPLVILRIDTPGGRLDSTRRITQAILASPVPVVGYVWPPGAQAASAGFFVLMSCDVAAMAPGTNAGAASPVGGQGEDLPKTIGKKVTEDASALLRSLAGPRGRPRTSP